MKIHTFVGASALVAMAGIAIAQPTIDGVYDAGTEGGFYTDLIWVNDNPTAFGDNSAGLFTGGDFGNPEVVDTGIEICIPLASLGLSGTESIALLAGSTLAIVHSRPTNSLVFFQSIPATLAMLRISMPLRLMARHSILISISQRLLRAP